jgi:hypothetical protein
MKKLIIFALILFLFVSSACSFSYNLFSKDEEPTLAPVLVESLESVQDVPEPTQTETVYSPPTAAPTKQVAATVELPTPTEVPPTPTEPVSACPQFGTEEFDAETDCWPHTLNDVFSPASITNRNKVFVQIKDSMLEFESQLTEDVDLYSFYQDNQYDEVNLIASITKIEPSVNSNGFALACHVNDWGWYEARIQSSGTFEILQYDAFKKQNGENPYSTLGSGGAGAYRIGTGRENIIEWQCRSNSLTLIINGTQTWEKKDFTSMNDGGGVGVGLASYSGKSPRHIGFEYVEIAQP